MVVKRGALLNKQLGEWPLIYSACQTAKKAWTGTLSNVQCFLENPFFKIVFFGHGNGATPGALPLRGIGLKLAPCSPGDPKWGTLVIRRPGSQLRDPGNGATPGALPLRGIGLKWHLQALVTPSGVL